MSIGSGIAAQVGIKAESAYGTPVTVDRFYEFNSEGFKTDVAKVYSRGLRNSRVQRADRVKTYIRGADGPLEMDILNKSFGLWFQHMLGQNTVSGAGANKSHTCIMDALALQGKFLTVQAGRPDSGGTIRAFTYEGAKVKTWEIKCVLDEVAKLMVELDYENVLVSTGLASASYVATQEPLIFSEGLLTIGGVTIAVVKSVSVKGDNNLKTDRRGLGNVKKEPLANGPATLEISVDAEFDDRTQYDALVAGTQAQLVLSFNTTTLVGGVPFSLTITIPAVEFVSADANVSGPEVLAENLTLMGLDDGTNPPITLLYVTSDTVA